MNLSVKSEVGARRWNERSSLSPRELDELEDHLRALVDLEMELDATLARPEAFAVAREALGEPRALSTEFARAGRPRWKRLLAGASALYAASLLLPILMTLPMLLGSRRPDRRWLRRILGGMGVANLGLGMSRVFSPAPFPYEEAAVAHQYPGAGYRLWSASFALAAAALWLRGRNWAASGSAESVAEGAV